MKQPKMTALNLRITEELAARIDNIRDEVNGKHEASKASRHSVSVWLIEKGLDSIDAVRSDD